MDVTLAGIDIQRKLEQPENEHSLMLVTAFPIIAVFKQWQCSKACSLIDVILSLNVMDVSPDLENAYSPIEVMLSGIDIEVKCVHS